MFKIKESIMRGSETILGICLAIVLLLAVLIQT